MKKLLIILAIFLSHFAAAQTCNVNYFTGNNTRFFAETDSSFWICTECKIVEIDKNTQQRTFHVPDNDIEECFSGNGQYSLVSNYDETEIYAARGFETYKYFNGNWQLIDTVHRGLFGFDKLGNRWYFFDDSLVKFDGTVFTSFQLPFSSFQGANAAIDSNNNIWFALDQTGLVKFDGTNLLNIDSTNSGISNNNMHSVRYSKKDHSLLVAGYNYSDTINFTPDFMRVSKLQNNIWTNYTISNDNCNGVNPASVWDMYSDSNGIWIASTGLVNITDTGTGIYTTCNSSYPQTSTFFIFRGFNDNMYIGTDLYGLMLVDTGSWQRESLSNSEFLGNNVDCICADNNNRLWIGNTVIGIGSRKERIYTFDGTNFYFDSSTNQIPYNHAEKCSSYDGSRVHFFNTYYNLEMVYTLNSNTTTFSVNNVPNTNYDLRGFATAPNGDLWASSFYASKFYRLSGNTWTQFNKSSLGLNYSHSDMQLAIANNGDRWFCTDDTLIRVSGTTQTTYACVSNCFNYTKDIEVNNTTGEIWLAANYLGFRTDGINWYELIPDSAFLNCNPKCVYFDNANNVYIGTQNHGLFVRYNSTWMHYSIENTNFLGRSVYEVTGDANGNIWLGTNKGITKFSPCGGDTVNVTETPINGVVVTSVKEIEVPQYSVYPNPASDLVNIETNDDLLRVNVFGLNGSLISTSERKQQVDISTLANGMYYLEIVTTSGIYRKKLNVLH